MSKENLYKAFVAAQKEISNPKKDTKAYNYKYAQLDQIINQVRPILAKHGLAVMQENTNDESGRYGVTTILLHESGESMQSSFFGTAVKQDPQSIGSLLTYFRRYGLMSLLGLAGEDDDGQAAMPNKQSTGPMKNERPTQPQIKAIYAIHSKAGKQVNQEWLKSLTFAQASAFIESANKR